MEPEGAPGQLGVLPVVGAGGLQVGPAASEILIDGEVYRWLHSTSTALPGIAWRSASGPSTPACSARGSATRRWCLLEGFMC